MADSLLDIGGEDIFPLSFNWVEPPKQRFNMTRYIRRYAGTITEIEEKNIENPIIFEGRFDIYSKQDEYDFLDFLHNHRGNVIRFWVKHPKKTFVLNHSVSIGSVQLICEENNANLSYQGYERIYLEMSNGDLITRRISGITHDIPNEEVQLDLVTAIDRVINPEDVKKIGRIYLVRFDGPDTMFDIHTNFHTSFSQRFYELVKEYSQLAAD